MNNRSISLNQIEILKNEPLSKYTFTKTGGRAEYLAFPQTIQQVKQLVSYAKDHRLPVTTLGNASNLIISDNGIKGLVMILTKLNQYHLSGNEIVAGAGVPIIDVSVLACQHSLSGLAFAAGIPGSVGGAVFMNAGAYGGSTSQVVESAQVLTDAGQIKTLTNQQLKFSYRHSVIQENHDIVLGATFELKPGNQNQIQADMDNFNAQRASKQPLAWPSCGSVFKRPKGHYAGQLIHDADLQGYRSGGAQVSRIHAGFIVNVDHATATDYLNVIHHVQHQVYKNSGVHLQTEVRILK
ncbi:MAG: UDP-N-acetylmuramate dehydrogenase [Acetilactobacillus jinshanensis]